MRLALRLESKLIIRLLIISIRLWRESNLVHVLVISLNPTLTCSCTVYIRLLLISWTSQLVSLLSMHFYLLPVNTEVLIMFVYLVDFASGLAFGLHGTIERVTKKVFLLSPANVSVSSEDKSAAAQASFFNQS